MTIAAFFTVFSIMNIGFLVAAVAIPGGFGILFTGFVAAIAAGFGMNTLESKIGFGMVEGRRI